MNTLFLFKVSLTSFSFCLAFDLASSNDYFGTLMVMLYFPHSFCIYNSSVGRVACFCPLILLCTHICIVSCIFIDLQIFILFFEL